MRIIRLIFITVFFTLGVLYSADYAYPLKSGFRQMGVFQPLKYGMKNNIDGKYKKGTRCILIEDVITTGSSILQTIFEMEQLGIIITKVITIVNRGNEGILNIQKKRVCDRISHFSRTNPISRK